ncbi:MAG: FG-GAP-like repeat-containing protein [Cytophagales bacterium]|nr:FG-GAP-like repeat-containing protein [Cytophagales bacterium]
MRLRFGVVLLVGGLTGTVSAQTPVINSVTPVSTYPSNKVLITGSGFSTNQAQLRVSFDHVRATITASSEFAIEATLPPQARLANVEVLHIISGLSGKFAGKMIPSFGGGLFDPLKVVAPLSHASPDEIFDVCACDLDGDGRPDLAGSKQGVGTDIMLLRNTSTVGALSFVSSTVAVTAQTFNLACGDLNGDGRPDLIASRAGATRNEIFVLRNTSFPGNITFAPLTTLLMDVGHLAFRLSIRDLNADGKPEVIVTNSFNSAGNIIYVFVNTSSGGVLSFAASPVKLTVTGANTTYGLDVQDLDGDNKPDIIVNQFTASHIFVLRNTSSATVSFAPAQQINLGATLNQLTTADFNLDGKLDIAVTSAFDNRAIVRLNQSTPGVINFGPESSGIDLATGTFPWGIDAGDIDGDGDVDLLVGNRGAGVVDMTVMRNNGNSTFTPIAVNAGKKSRNVRIGDFDGDGKPDFAFTSDTGNSLDIIRNRNCFVPTILNASPLTICATQTIRLNSIPGVSVTNFDWKESGVSVSSGIAPFYDVTTVGNYTVTATSEGGACVEVSNIVVVNAGAGAVPTDPVISSNAPLCNVPGQNLQLNGPGGAGLSYIWTGPNGFTSGLQNPQVLNVTAADAGFYILQVSNGTCFSNQANTRVDIANLANFSVGSSITSNTICQGSNLTLTVNSQSGYSYQWRKDGIDIPGQITTSLVVTQEAAYTVRVTNTGLACSLTTSPPINVIVLSQPVAGFSVNPTGCVGTSLAFTDQSTKDSRATAVYAWNFGDAGTATVPSPSHTYLAASTFNPSLTVSYTGVTGCSNNVSKPTAIANNPTITITTDKTFLVVGEAAQLQASGATTYLWTPTVGLSDPSIANPIAMPTITTTYDAVGTTNGCSGTGSITIDVSNIPPPAPGTVGIPNIFTPNGDSVNDLWIVQNLESECVVSVFDPGGRRVFEGKGPVSWDGNYSGAKAPDGTYFYVMTCPTSGTLTGHVLLAR